MSSSKDFGIFMGQSLPAQWEHQSSRAELQSTEQEVRHASEVFKDLLRENQRHHTPPCSPGGVFDHGTPPSHPPSVKDTASYEADDTVYPPRDPHGDGLHRGDRTIYGKICNLLEPQEMDPFFENPISPERSEPPTNDLLSLEDCYTPSDALLYSLGSYSRMYRTFRDFSNKVDISVGTQSTRARPSYRDAMSRPKTNSGQESNNSLFHTIRLSLPRLLAEYLRSCWPTSPDPGSTDIGPHDIVPSESALQNVFSEENLTYIHEQGYEPEDLVSWAWIVTADSTDRAVRRLMALSAESRFGSSESRMIPTFLFLFALRRSNWSARAVRMMIIHGRDRLESYSVAQGQPLDAAYEFSKTRAQDLQPPGISHRFMSKSNVVMMVIRLLRHARRAWPEAVVFIAMMFTKYEEQSYDTPLERRKIAELTYDYNTILSLLAIPASIYPFLSVSAQQQAQFTIIRRMNEFDPPLVVDREGYRAVIRLQLAHKKTLQERDWASLKATSWPPWKQDKLGLDAEKDIQYGQSGASQAIRQLQEAGYALGEWESSAEILAGWDTDGTPTIQRRAWNPRPTDSRNGGVEESTPSHAPKALEWKARIQATRTIDEAWACFLAFKDTMSRDGIPSKHPQVYEAMAERIVFDQKRSVATEQGRLQEAEPQPGDITPLPGDGKEVFERPGPQEAIYVRSSAPNMDEFFDMMLQDNVVPSQRCLAFILSHATTFPNGVHYLLHSHLPEELVRTLLIGDPTPIAHPIIHRDTMSNFLFGGFIHFLTRFPRRIRNEDLIEFNFPERGAPGTGHQRVNAMVQACKVVVAYKPYYRPPWNSLLLALVEKGVSLETVAGNVNRELQELLAWQTMQKLVDEMQRIGLGLDFSGFRYVCIGYENAFVAKEELATATCFPSVRDHIRERLGCSVRGIIHDGVSYIKDLFTTIVYGAPARHRIAWLESPFPEADALLPRLLETPSPAHIHPLIRIFGLRGDHRPIVEFVEWMGKFAPELQTRADELMNGKRMLRQCLTAAVVFLEQRWLPPEERMKYGERYNDRSAEESGDDAGRTIACESIDLAKISSLAMRFRRVIDENPDWGGWPSEDEIDMYMEHTRSPRVIASSRPTQGLDADGDFWATPAEQSGRYGVRDGVDQKNGTGTKNGSRSM
ncbi:MAG: hypothetical protein HETSPECPRED_008304 [Heterodermia speciosa]|uniref:Uncharacterized protein n=1 Tax=Heterodermia speciosa TaxID=116794 RepID=A0A8H3G095_9LECA|nr:MAG: hypothetical protein HETSPECPRED_008304 [Heterodermia speciosa]